MESFGEYLRSMREEKGVDLERIAENTKIALSNLQLLEKDRYDLLPPRVFLKGFIRSYALEVGINPDEALEQFERFSLDGELPDYEEDEHPLFHQRPATPSFIHSTAFTVALTSAGAISLSIILFTIVSRLFFFDGSSSVAQPKVTTVEPPGFEQASQAGPQAAPVSTDAFSQPAPTQPGKKVLEIQATANTWVTVRPDDGPPEELVMAPGDIEIFTANERFHVLTGNAGGIKVRFDGEALPSLGEVNETKSLTIP